MLTTFQITMLLLLLFCAASVDSRQVVNAALNRPTFMVSTYTQHQHVFSASWATATATPTCLPGRARLARRKRTHGGQSIYWYLCMLLALILPTDIPRVRMPIQRLGHRSSQGCTGCTCTPRAEKKILFGPNLHGKVVAKCNPQAEHAPLGRAKVLFRKLGEIWTMGVVNLVVLASVLRATSKTGMPAFVSFHLPRLETNEAKQIEGNEIDQSEPEPDFHTSSAFGDSYLPISGNPLIRG